MIVLWYNNNNNNNEGMAIKMPNDQSFLGVRNFHFTIIAIPKKINKIDTKVKQGNPLVNETKN